MCSSEQNPSEASPSAAERLADLEVKLDEISPTDSAAQRKRGVRTSGATQGKSERQALDDEEAALQKAIEELTNSSNQAARSPEYDSELRSGTLRDIEKVSMDVRSFVQGVKANVERLTSTVSDKLVIESNLALRIGDYLLRRALFDTSRALTGAAATAVAVLAPASAESNTTTTAASASAARLCLRLRL